MSRPPRAPSSTKWASAASDAAPRGHGEVRPADAGCSGLRVSAAEIEAAKKACDASTLDALKLARDRIEKSTIAASCRRNERFTDPLGVELGWRYTAINPAGLD